MIKLSAERIEEGECVPPWYGIAYYDVCSKYAICYPVPVNLIVRWSRNVSWLLRRGKKDALNRAYDAGYSAGTGQHRAAVETINRIAKLRGVLPL